MRLSLIQLSTFRSNWRRMGLSDEDLQDLEAVILEDPAAAPVMSGTGGLRKIRFSASHRSGGKSGGARVCYAYFRDFGLIYLCAVFPKSEKANLSQEEKNAYRNVLADFEDYLRKHFEDGWTP